jgi:cysteine synthase A
VRYPNVCESILDVVGETPLVALSRLTEGCRSRVLAKLESANPGLSVKDRPALQLLRDAEKQGRLRKGMTVIERTSGNMGTGLALACLHLGYRLVVLMSEGNSVERRQIIEALGGKVILVPQVTGTPGQVTAQDLKAVERETIRLMNEMGAYRADQFHNPSSVRAHERGTGPEIWKQTRGQVDVFVSVAGSAGTFVGVSRYLKRRKPSVRCYAVEPTNAALLSGRRRNPGRHRLQGVGYMEIPPLWEKALADGFISVSDSAAIRTARMLGRKEGILAGFTTGANVAAALRVARSSRRRLTVVTIITDSGLKYLSTDLYPDTSTPLAGL